MRAARRFLTWFAHSLPLYSWRRCCIEWEAGRAFERGQLGITRGTHGHFVSTKFSPAAMVGPSVTSSRSKAGTESSGQGNFLLSA
jgi:hypothetical protein